MKKIIKYRADDETLFDSEEECVRYEDAQAAKTAINNELRDNEQLDGKDWYEVTELLSNACPYALKKYVEYLIKGNENANI